MLLLASLIFYAWGEPVYILLMLISILFNYFAGLLIAKTHSRLILALDIIVNVSALIYFKAFGNVVGISFFTFQILSYIIDLYRGQYEVQKNPLNLALYISFFPQLIAGPIVKYKDIEAQIEERTVSVEGFSQGIIRFCFGLGKKVLIANVLAQVVDRIYALPEENITTGLAWVAAVYYMLQIYFDFSGYSDMAIGLGRMFGFTFLENFNYPYISTSIKEFWRRWHISLSTWFKEYLYIPLGGNRKGQARTLINLFIVFLVTGLWHGVGATFVLWGLWHGIFSILERTRFSAFLKKYKVIGYIYTTFVVLIGWVLFRAENWDTFTMMISHMFDAHTYGRATLPWQEIVSNRSIVMCGIGIIAATLWGRAADANEGAVIPSKNGGATLNEIGKMVFAIIVLVLSIAALSANSYNPFIYFRF